MSVRLASTGEQSRWLIVFLGAIISFRLVTGVLYSLITPPWQAPDEPRHFEHARLLLERGRPLSVADTDPQLQRQILQSMVDSDFWSWYFGPRPERTPTSFKEIWPSHYTMLHRPSLYYWLGLPFLGFVSERSLVAQLEALRLFSVMLGACTVLVAFLTARVLFPRDAFMALGTASFVALVPMYAWLSGMLNNDNLAALSVSLVTLCVALIFRRGLSWRLVLATLAAAGLAVVSKRTSVAEVAVLPLVPVVYYWGRPERHARIAVGLGAATLAVAMAVGGIVAFRPTLLPWLAKPLGSALMNSPSYALKLLNHPYLSWEFLQLLWRYAEVSVWSFWALFGWMTLSVDSVWYDALKVAHLGSAAGLLLLLVRSWLAKGSLRSFQVKALLLYAVGILLLIVLAVAEAAYYFAPNHTPQGRYFFTLIVPIGLFFTLGWHELLPARCRPMGLLALMCFFLLFNSVCLFWYFPSWFRWSL